MSKVDLYNPQYQSVIFPAIVTKGLAVKLGTNEKEVAVVSAATDFVVGFVELPATVAKGTGTIFTEGGECYGVAKAAITKGNQLVIAADGKINPRGTTAGTYHCLGYALEAAAANATFRFRFNRFSVTVS